MGNLAKGLNLGVVTIAVAAILVVAFVWAGPGGSAFTGSAVSAVELFDEENVVTIYERVGPAVVQVNTGRGFGSNVTGLGSGSGFLIDSEGYIVTNYHVVQDASRVMVKFMDGATAEATVLGSNPANDLVLLKVDASEVQGIQPIPLGNSSDLKSGRMAIAIGSPFGLEGTLTVGVISQVNRSLPSSLGRSISNVIQTDAYINRGNSGGPLLDSSGAVVGINTAIQTDSNGISRGIGFAVPVDTLKTVLPRLEAAEVVRPPWLGVQAGDINSLLAERLNLPVDRGVYVIGVAPNSPAKDSGLRQSGTDRTGRATRGGDIITAVDGVAVDTTADLIAELNKNGPGDTATLTIIRGGEAIQVAVTLGEWPGEQSLRDQRPPERQPQHDDRESFREFFDREYFREFFRGDRFQRFFERLLPRLLPRWALQGSVNYCLPCLC